MHILYKKLHIICKVWFTLINYIPVHVCGFYRVFPVYTIKAKLQNDLLYVIHPEWTNSKTRIKNYIDTTKLKILVITV